MGQVYRARDTKLNRDVALKVLPDSFASDADRLARFTREAQTLASLNDPNIAHIHGLETGQVGLAGQVGKDAGTLGLVSPAQPAPPALPAFIVMELVEGEDSRSGSRVGRFRSMRHCQSRNRSPRRWKRRTIRGSSIAI